MTTTYRSLDAFYQDNETRRSSIAGRIRGVESGRFGVMGSYSI